MPLDRVAEGVLASIASQRSPAVTAARTSGATPSSLASSGAASTASLEVMALGPLQVRRDGELLGVDRWGSAKARELLLFLLCQPGGCSREQVGVALWPDASSAQLRNVFHVTLHRLRKALDRPGWIVLEGERYRLSSDVACELDATTFERDVTAARRELTRGRDAFDRLRQVLALYRGAFLEGEPVGDWHLELRDRLERLFVDALLALGGRLMDANRYQEAADAYRRVIERDALHEESYRHLMICLSRTGERPQALRLYQRLTQALRDELATAPAPETARVFSRLQSGTD
jgi:DNA-binding SARP family transcriptional activator